MGKVYIPSEDLTAADRLREELDEIELRLSQLDEAGPEVVTLLYLFDRARTDLHELEAAGTDVRAERGRFEAYQRGLREEQARVAAQAGDALPAEREAVDPSPAQWWWFLDDAVAEARRNRLRRTLIWVGIGVATIVVGLVLYNQFLAPPPEMREALGYAAQAESAVDQGHIEAALPRFEAAATRVPDDPEYALWLGVLHAYLGEQEMAEGYFQEARAGYESQADFLLERGQIETRVGLLEVGEDHLTRAIEIDQDLAAAYYLRSSIYQTWAMYDAAVADLERAIELAEANGDIRLLAMSRIQLAVVTQERAVSPLPPPTSSLEEENDG